MLVAQAAPAVEVYSRHGTDWTLTTYGSGDTVYLASIDLNLPMALVYADVTFEAPLAE